MNKDEWVREMAHIDPSLHQQLDVLWDQLTRIPDPPSTEVKRRIWSRLIRTRSPFWMYARAWRLSWVMLPGRRVGILAMGPLLALLATWLVPVHHYVNFAWWGLLSPWAGLLMVPILNLSTESGTWVDWEAVAPLDPGLRMAVDWFITMGIMAVAATLVSGLIVEPTTRLHLLMMWVGPFGFTSIGTVLLMRKLGALWSVVVTSLFWGSQTLIGSIALVRAKTTWSLWFANVRAPIWPDLVALGVGVGVAIYVGQRGWWSWISG